MADPDNYPLLEEAESDQVDFLFAHPNFVNLAISCGPFFRWMLHHDKSPVPNLSIGAVTGQVTIDVASFTLNGVTYPLYILPQPSPSN